MAAVVLTAACWWDHRVEGAEAKARAAALRFSMLDTAGARHSEAEWARARAVVLFFIGVDCPVSNQYVPEMNRMAEAYAGRDVVTYGVIADAWTSRADASRYAEAFGLRFPLLMDSTSVLVHHVGATVTPEAAVLANDGSPRYVGRIDNRIADLSTHRAVATVFDLCDALDAVLAGRAVAHARVPAIGCFIHDAPPASSRDW